MTQQGGFNIPDTNSPLVAQDLKVSQQWQAFFQNLYQRSSYGKIQDLLSGVSPGFPYVFKAKTNGTLVIQGTITTLTFKRGETSIDIPAVSSLPISQNDEVSLDGAFTGLYFIPN